MVAPNFESSSPPPEDDPMGPPSTPVEVECIHCGNVYMSDQIRWEPDPQGPGGGWWVCPIDGCDGAGFCFDIYPTDPKVAEQFGVHTHDFDEDEDAEGFAEPNGEETPGKDGPRDARGRMSVPRRLKIDLEALAGAMEGMAGEEAREFLDLRSGELHLVDDYLLRAVENDETDNVPDWQREVIPIARAVLDGEENLIEIPRIESGDAFETMREFVAQLKDPAARDALSDALNRPKPFRRFKDALFDFPAVREQWFTFENARQERLAREWLAEIGVEPIEA